MTLQTPASATAFQRGLFALRRRWLACLHAVLILIPAVSGMGSSVTEAERPGPLLGLPDVPSPWIEGDDELARGNLAPVETAIQRQDLRSLWYYYRRALEERYWPAGSGGNGLMSNQKTLNAAVAERAASGLRQIPGHALFLADEVEALSQRPFPPYAAVEVRQVFHVLGALGSPEAIQQIARFLDDQRDFYAAAPPSDVPLMCGFVTPAYPTSVHAANALHQALGEKSPLFGKVSPRTPLLGDGVAEMQRWWHSWQARSCRQQLPGVPLPEWRTIPGRFPLPPWYQRLSSDMVTTLMWSAMALAFAGLVWWSRSLRMEVPMKVAG